LKDVSFLKWSGSSFQVFEAWYLKEFNLDFWDMCCIAVPKIMFITLFFIAVSLYQEFKNFVKIEI
jgi:hypothetical protein